MRASAARSRDALAASGGLAQDAPEAWQTAGPEGSASPAEQRPWASFCPRAIEIKAAVPNGTRYVVFLQKDQSAYACEFVSLTTSRCGTIN